MSDETGVKVRRRRTRSEIAQIVAQFSDSGLNRTEFCRRHGMSWETLNRQLQRSACRPHDGLVAVELTGDEITVGRDGCLAVVLSGGRRVEVSAGFDATTLQRLIILLEKM